MTSHEESVRFSLKELTRLEDERIAETRRDAAAREASLRRAEEDAVLTREAEARAAAKAREEENAKMRRAEAEEIVRCEAMQKALVEQSRLEVEVRARAQERDLERRHELDLQRLKAQGNTRQIGPIAGGALIGGLVMGVVGVALHFGVTRPAHEREIARIELGVADAEGRADRIGRAYEAQQKQIDTLEKQLQRVRSDPAPAHTVPSPTPAPPVTTHVVRPTPPPPPKCIDDRDPLCGTINGR